MVDTLAVKFDNSDWHLSARMCVRVHKVSIYICKMQCIALRGGELWIKKEQEFFCIEKRDANHRCQTVISLRWEPTATRRLSAAACRTPARRRFCLWIRKRFFVERTPVTDPIRNRLTWLDDVKTVAARGVCSRSLADELIVIWLFIITTCSVSHLSPPFPRVHTKRFLLKTLIMNNYINFL